MTLRHRSRWRRTRANGATPRSQRPVLTDGELAYDFLIVATGATHDYFGHDERARHAPGLETIEDAVEIRRRVLLAFEAAERETDRESQRAHLTFAIVGAESIPPAAPIAQPPSAATARRAIASAPGPPVRRTDAGL